MDKTFQSGQVLHASELNDMVSAINANETAVNSKASELSVNLLGVKVAETDLITLQTEYTNGKKVKTTDGTTPTMSEYFSVSDYINIVGFDIVQFKMYMQNYYETYGVAFYNNNKTFICGYSYPAKYNQSDEDSLETMQMEIPQNSAYMRYTILESMKNEMFVYGIKGIKEDVVEVKNSGGISLSKDDFSLQRISDNAGKRAILRASAKTSKNGRVELTLLKENFSYKICSSVFQHWKGQKDICYKQGVTTSTDINVPIVCDIVGSHEYINIYIQKTNENEYFTSEEEVDLIKEIKFTPNFSSELQYSAFDEIKKEKIIIDKDNTTLGEFHTPSTIDNSTTSKGSIMISSQVKATAVSDYVPVTGSIIEVSLAEDLAEGVVLRCNFGFFDKNLNFIGRDSEYKTIPASVHIPPQASYYRIIINTRNSDNSADIDITTENFTKVAVEQKKRKHLSIVDYAQILSNNNKSRCVNSINHRGYNTIEPENTLPAYILSKRMGFDVVETDVAFTLDNVAVLLHDRSINRTANNIDGTAISGTVNIDSINYSALSNYTFNKTRPTRPNCSCPTLEEFLLLCKDLGLHAYIEIKEPFNTETNVNSIVDIVRECGMRKNVTYISFSKDALVYVKNKEPKARLGLVCMSLSNTIVTDAISLKSTNNEVFVDTRITDTGIGNYVSSLADEDIALEVWEGDITPYQLDNLHKYISGVTCNSCNWGIYSEKKY